MVFTLGGMDMPASQPANFMNEGVRFLSICPLCETNYNPLEARILGEQDTAHLVHIQCRKCLNALLALVMVNQMGISSVGLITDLTFDDVLKYKDEEVVNADDALAVHQMLEDDDAFLKALL